MASLSSKLRDIPEKTENLSQKIWRNSMMVGMYKINEKFIVHGWTIFLVQNFLNLGSSSESVGKCWHM
jgi:hypothetical protein